jgi:hypothetical protein
MLSRLFHPDHQTDFEPFRSSAAQQLRLSTDRSGMPLLLLSNVEPPVPWPRIPLKQLGGAAGSALASLKRALAKLPG